MSNGKIAYRIIVGVFLAVLTFRSLPFLDEIIQAFGRYGVAAGLGQLMGMLCGLGAIYLIAFLIDRKLK